MTEFWPQSRLDLKGSERKVDSYLLDPPEGHGVRLVLLRLKGVRGVPLDAGLVFLSPRGVRGGNNFCCSVFQAFSSLL